MTEEWAKRARELYLEALELAPEERPGFLAKACAEDDALRAEVESLLGYDASTQPLLHDAAIKAVIDLESDTDESEASSQLLDKLVAHSPRSSRYSLKGEVARGGMGAILKVWDEDLRRHLAMKVAIGQTSPSGDGSTSAVDPKTLGRFLEEAQVTGQLDHPGVVPVHELGLDSEGRVYFTMRLVRGRDLKAVFDLVKTGAEDWNRTRALGVLLKACEALAYAHSHGVIHRDLKPANIMVGRFGEVYVMDWGLAKVKGRKDTKNLRLRPGGVTSVKSLETVRRDEAEGTPDSPLITMDGDVMGTPSYMSPEQAEGEIDKIGPRSDVYAMGAILYELLTGQMPYLPPGKKRSPRVILANVQEGAPKPIRDLSADVPGELEAVCDKAMARTPADRYEDVTHLASDLRAYLEGRVVRAYRTGAIVELRKWVQRNKALASSFLLLLVFLMAGGGALAWLADERKRANEDLSGSLQRESELTASLSTKNQESAEALERESRLTASLLTKNQELAEALERETEALSEAQRQRALADESAEEARRERSNVMRLSALQELEDLTREADELWPVGPELVPEYQDWMHRASQLVAGLEPSDDGNYTGHLRQLAEIRERALPRSDEEREVDRRNHLRFAELEAKVKAIVLAAERLEEASDSDGASDDDSIRAELMAAYRERADLESIVSERQTWRFESSLDTWWHGRLEETVLAIEAFADPLSGLMKGISATHGWGIERRLRFAEIVEERTLTGPEATRRWDKARASIADPKACPAYGGLEIEPQLGLLPIGQDPVSGLWEFWHLASGDEPRREDDGRLVFADEMGLVLVLLPGGAFFMGAQQDSPQGRNYDQFAQLGESPVHEVTLSPFFLSKYELTQHQWRRLTASEPSKLGPRLPFPGRQPVEQVSWDEAMLALPRVSLTPPTEAQWEYGARAGTETAWWMGPLTSVGAMHINNHLTSSHLAGDIVGANPFGLHHVHGNVSEWCLDGYEGAFYERSGGVDPSRDPQGAPTRVIRGGGFASKTVETRAAHRDHHEPGHRRPSVGIRPAMLVVVPPIIISRGPPWIESAPGVYDEGSSRMFYAVGTAPHNSNRALQKNQALARTRSELARSIKSHVDSLVLNYMLSNKDDYEMDTASAAEYYNDIARQVTDESVFGARHVQTYRDPSDNSLYIRLRNDYDDLLASYREQMIVAYEREAARGRIKASAEEFHRKLDEQLSWMRALSAEELRALDEEN